MLIKKELVRKPHRPRTIGNIKCGGKNAKGYPESHDYFSCEGDYKSLFDAHYGEKPSKIMIKFDGELDQCLDHRYVLAKSTQSRHDIIAYTDLETYFVYHNGEYKPYLASEHKGIHENLELKHNLQWKEELSLYFYVYGVNVLGKFRFITHAENSTIIQIRDTISEVFDRYDTIVPFVFDLTVKKVKSNKPEVTHNFPVVSLNLNMSVEARLALNEQVENGLNLKEYADKGLMLKEKQILIEGK